MNDGKKSHATFQFSPAKMNLSYFCGTAVHCCTYQQSTNVLRMLYTVAKTAAYIFFFGAINADDDDDEDDGCSHLRDVVTLNSLALYDENFLHSIGIKY